jgi:predicted metal-dependent peptidase
VIESSRRSRLLVKESGLVKARAYVKANGPYLSTALMSLVPHPVENLTEKIGGPMGVTPGMVCYYDPEWVNNTPESKVGTGLAHEIFHHLLKHFSRGISYANKKRWNRACDYFINHALLIMTKQVGVPDGQGGLTYEDRPVWDLEKWALVPEWHGLPTDYTADQYYHLLEDLEQKGKAPDYGDPKIMAGGCGGVSGNANDFERELDEKIGRTEADVNRIRRSTARAIKEASKRASGRGSSPSAFAEIISSIDRVAVVPWHVTLASIVRATFGRARTGGLDYSISRPSRRSLVRGIILPGLIKRDFIVLIVLDTSASMGKEQLESALSEAAGVMEQCGLDEVWVLQVDAGVQTKPTRTTCRELKKMKMLGRGGTDFRPAFEVAVKMRPRPDVIIYMTDGDGTAPDRPPAGIEVVWCIPPTRYAMRPPWGEVVTVDRNQVLRGHY